MRNILRSLILPGVIYVIAGCGKSNQTPAINYVCPSNRFISEQFTVSSATITYTQSVDYLGKNQNLLLDIYSPAVDTLSRRPLIIYCHGGNFTSGARNSSWPVKFCQSFAKRGYVTASIDYRLGIGTNGDADVMSAQIRAGQDAKAAVRYFKQTAVEQGNPYRIDTAQIYIAGEASGAIIALQTGYLNSADQFAGVGNADLLSSLNGIEGSTTSPYSSHIKGVISLSGAILDLNWLTNINMPLIMVHGTNDAVIPYRSGIVNPYTATPLYGSYLIDSVAASRKLNTAFHAFAGAGATPYAISTKYADSTITYVSQELVGLIDCQRLGLH
ncbi:alpha/beta hydrolase fold domain-containing protein [Mucilaginibacter sp. AW1-3]